MIKVEIERLWSDDAGQSVETHHGDARWRVNDLVDQTRDLEVFDLPLAHINLESDNFECRDLYEFAQHMMHVLDADLGKPIIMNNRGQILDGRHRIVAALLAGHESIKCKRMECMGSPTEWK